MKAPGLRCLTSVLIFCTIYTSIQGSRVLLAPWPFQSHISQFLNIGEGLIDNGHDVYVVTTPSLPSLDKIKATRVKLILYAEDEPDFYSQSSSDEEMTDSMLKFMDMTLKEDFRTSIKGFQEMCTNPLKDKKLYKTLGDVKFDLAIVDVFPMYRCFLVLMHRLDIPFVNLITFPELWLLRNPALPSATPFILGENSYSTEMTFWQRLDNLWSIFDWTAFTGVSYMEDKFLKEYFYETTPVPLNELTGRAMLWLIDQTTIMDYPNPTMPNQVLVGGLTTKPAKPLPEDLEKFMSSNPNGAIVVSFGSMGNSLPDWILDELIAAFELVKYNVVMRFPVERAKKVSAHIKLISWLPQNDLLGHKNTKLFVTHCGANGQIEGLYHGVPMVGFPMFAEQYYNARRSEYHGFGLNMDLRTFKAQELADMIVEVIENPKYTDNIRAASTIFLDQPMTPREKALYWIEHVIKHGGRHLRSHALDMVWYEYLMLDIVLFILGVFTGFVLVSCCVIKKVLSMLGGTKQKAKAD